MCPRAHSSYSSSSDYSLTLAHLVARCYFWCSGGTHLHVLPFPKLCRCLSWPSRACPHYHGLVFGWEEQLSTLTRPSRRNEQNNTVAYEWARPPLGLHKAPGHINNVLMRMCAITVINTAQRQATVRSLDFQEGFVLHTSRESWTSTERPFLEPPAWLRLCPLLWIHRMDNECFLMKQSLGWECYLNMFYWTLLIMWHVYCGLIWTSYICLFSIVPGVMKAMNHRLSTCVC